MYHHAAESDPAPFNSSTFASRWDSHFAQGDCPTDMILRYICASLFACFVWHDFVQSCDMCQWLFYVTRGQPGERPGLFFPAELQIKITPSPFGDAESAAEREIISRVPLLYRLFMLVIVILPKMLIAGERSNGWLGRALLPTLAVKSWTLAVQE